MGAKKNTKDISDLSKRFLLALEMTGYTAYRLEKEVEAISSPMITHIKNGRNEPSVQVIAAFLKKFPTVNGHWLLSGIGDPILKSETGNKTKSASYDELLHKIPVEEIAAYIQRYQQVRGFDENEIFKALLEVYVEERLNEKLAALEAKVDALLKQGEDTK